MLNLLKNKLILLLVCATLAILVFNKDEAPLPPVTAKQAPTSKAVDTAKMNINPNPKQRKSLKNPFKPLPNNPVAPSQNTSVSQTLSLNGIVAHNSEFVAIIAIQGKTDFYQLNQQILDYTVQEINSTSAVLYNHLTRQRVILHIKE